MGKRTPLFEIHRQLQAKIVEFAGFDMPVSYSGIIEEHMAVRQKAGIFDVSHMGEFIFSGKKALEQVQSLVTNDISKLEIWQAQYAMMCKEDGGIVDDVLVYRLPNRYLMVVNAANRDKDFAWVKKNSLKDTDIRDASDEYALIAVQGPESLKIVRSVASKDISGMAYYHAMELEVGGIPVICSRTGYTGEQGFELFVAPESAASVWECVSDSGRNYGMLPAGLGARDSLRLEKCMRLYGNDMDESTNPYEAGLGRWVKLDKGDFLGRKVLIKAKEQGVSRKLAGFHTEGRAIARHGYAILRDGKEIGTVSSGGFSPVLRRGIGLGYVKREFSEIDTQVEIDIRGKSSPAIIVKTPFV